VIDLRVSLVLGLSRLFGHGPLARFGTRNTAQTASAESMIADRTAAVPLYHHLFSRFCDFSGKTVVELGCSRGYLLAEFLASGRFHAIGVDRDSRALAAGAARYGPDITFVQSSEETIPLPDASCDHAFTVDVIEHLSHPGAIFREMHRILRPGGRFLIYFHPWLGPYGAHLGDIVPFPWPHVLFGGETLRVGRGRGSPLHAARSCDRATQGQSLPR
jgi:SAM-dependent methyltransferase